MSNAEISAVLEQIADLLEFQGANAFRIRAYRGASRAIHDLPEPVEAILADLDRKLTDIKGIGKDLAEKVSVYFETGSIPLHEELLEGIPHSVLAILRVPGLGPKRAAVLHRELGVDSLDDLREACQSGEVRKLKGFAVKTEAAILQGLAVAAEADERLLWARADVVAQAIREHLMSHPAVESLELAGSYRRGKETVGDLDILVVSTDADAVMDRFATLDDIQETLLRGPTKMSVRLGRRRLQVDLRVVRSESFGAALQYFTGSKEHNVVLRGMAKSRGLKISEYGVFRGEKQIAGRTEQEVYAAVDLPWIPPELREDRQEFDWAADGRLPDLITLQDIRGDLHAHSTWSDGTATIEQMAAAAQNRGLDYLAVTDHSKRVAMAGGLDGDALRRQWDAIDQLNEQLAPFVLLKSVECDILEGGGMDLDDHVLALADWVVASIHYGQNQSRQRITQRIVEALQNPHVSAIAHPTGRILTRRHSYEIDLDAVLQTAKEHGKLMELNAHPSRLDLDDVACAAAKSLGVPIVISSDAHHIDGLDVMRFGVQQARRAGLTKQDVVNTRSWVDIRDRQSQPEG